MQESSANANIPELETGMSAWGKKRRFEFRPVTSGLPLSTDILKGRWHVSNLHISRHLDMQRTGN